MKLERLSIKNLCLLIGAGALLSMLVITAVFYALTSDPLMLFAGAALTACALVWLFLQCYSLASGYLYLPATCAGRWII